MFMLHPNRLWAESRSQLPYLKSLEFSFQILESH